MPCGVPEIKICLHKVSCTGRLLLTGSCRSPPESSGFSQKGGPVIIGGQKDIPTGMKE